MSAPLEIERKYLIDRPDEAMLASLPGAVFFDIKQTYLIAFADGEGRRVREKTDMRGRRTYIETVKRRQSERTAEEYEHTITRAEYEELLLLRDPERRTVLKRRYVIPHGEYRLEVDLYPFWKRTAVLEVELSHEDEEVDFPDFLHILREVSDDKAFKNRSLALRVPREEDIRP